MSWFESDHDRQSREREREFWRHQARKSTEALECICDQLGRIADLLEQLFPQVKDFGLSQIQGGVGPMAITGVVVGGSGVFQESPVPSTNFVPLQSGPSFAADDPLVTLSPSPDADPTKVVAAVAATDTATSFNLTVSGVNGAGTAISHVFNIPILPAPPPPPVQVTDFSLNQLS